jgi:tetratricopeptide (TPR) repeat protein
MAEDRAREALALAEGEGGTKALEFVRGDEEILALILQVCNTTGIAYRKAGQYDRAIAEFRKALVFHPLDEGLHYNIARAYLEMRDWKEAERAIRDGLTVNPNFPEGKALLNYIRAHAAAPSES